MADEEQKKSITEVKAFATAVHISPRKARLVADLLRNMPVDEALEQLGFMTKRAAGPIRKLLDSAIANASHNFQIEQNRLFIKHLSADQGRVFFRYAPRAQGRALPIRKRTSHLNLVLGVNQIPFKSKKVFKKAEKPKEADGQEKAEKPPMAAEKKSRFAFWRNLPRKAGKKEQDVTQLPPKEDPKGRHYTSFDRRGNMGA